jgi:hypothetical protein
MADKTRQKDLFLAALLVQPTIVLAARAAGISEATAQRWLKDAAFQQAYADARKQALGEALAFLQGAMLAAVSTLKHVMLSTDTKPVTQVAAARTILEMGLRSLELEAVDARIAKLVEEMETFRAHL